MRKSITSRCQIPGFHQWREAPDAYSYLKNIHRHIFHFDVEIFVDESREIEFINFKHFLIKTIKEIYQDKEPLFDLEGSVNFGNSSCEDIAENLFNFLIENNTDVKEISVSEDGENGATVYFQ